MYQLINSAYDDNIIDQYGGADALQEMVECCGCDGIEWVWGGRQVTRAIPQTMINGYHLTFFSDWLDYYLGNDQRLVEKFGSETVWRNFYEGSGADDLITRYRQDLGRAREMKALYTVFHASDVSIEETYTYRKGHTDEQVIDAICQIINRVYGSRDLGPTLLLENLWWAGFRFTEPALTERLLSQIEYPNKGIMLDTGHLMNCNWNLTTQEEACTYILKQYRAHGSLGKYVKGFHLHQSLSGKYARAHAGTIPEGMPEDYVAKFCFAYGHIQNIDTHQPFESPAVQALVDEIQPLYLVHELAAADREEKIYKVTRQQRALNLGRKR